MYNEKTKLSGSFSQKFQILPGPSNRGRGGEMPLPMRSRGIRLLSGRFRPGRSACLRIPAGKEPRNSTKRQKIVENRTACGKQGKAPLWLGSRRRRRPRGWRPDDMAREQEIRPCLQPLRRCAAPPLTQGRRGGRGSCAAPPLTQGRHQGRLMRT